MTQQNEHRAAIRAARETYDRARTELFAAIRAGLDAGVGVSAVSRDADFSREYITRIRDGKGPKDAQVKPPQGDESPKDAPQGPA
jgi:hypothetical protein